MKKLLTAWRKMYGTQALLMLGTAALFVLPHLLAGGGLRELRYALVLACVLGTAAFIISVVRLAARLRQLDEVCRHLPEDAAQLPEPVAPLEAGWRTLAEAYQAQTRTLTLRMAQQAQEEADYYTLWLHQMKTPLSALHLMAQSPGEMDRALLRQETLKIGQYAQAALDYQRLSSLHSDLQLASAALYPLCCQAVRELRPLFLYGQIALKLEPFSGVVLTDSKWLLVVLSQVLTNALKYTPAGGCITIAQPEEGVLTIQDTGIGIRPEDAARVFDRGFTGHTGRTQEKSTGIGLYLCKRICDELGHGIALASRVGEGTTVTLDLRRRRFESMD